MYFYFTPFCLNAPYQFTPHLNLRSLIFRLTPFWLAAFCYTYPLFTMGMYFYFTPLCLNAPYQFTPHLNLHSLIFRLTPFWLAAFCYTYPLFTMGMYFYFTPLCLNAPYQFTPHLNLRSLIFRLTPFGWLRSATLTPYLRWECIFIYDFFIYAHFFRNATRA